MNTVSRRKSEARSESLHRRWAEGRFHRTEQGTANIRRWWRENNPAKNKSSEEHSERARLQWMNPEFRTKQMAIRSSAEYKEKKRTRTLRQWREDQNYRHLLTIGRRGENNPAWAGGKGFEPYTAEFNRQLKELIRQRDGYKCRLCGVPECECRKKLAVHHIDYEKSNCLPSNLISLCLRCNVRVNSKRDYWPRYFLFLLKQQEDD